MGVYQGGGIAGRDWQKRKRVREARETRKEEMIYEKQLEVLEEAIKSLNFMNIEWKKFVGVHEKLLANKPSEEQLAVLEEEGDIIAQILDEIMEESREVIAKISTYLSLETEDAFREYLAQLSASMKGVEERLRRGEEGDFEETKERLNVAYQDTVLKMREHLGISKFWASGRSLEPFSRPKS